MIRQDPSRRSRSFTSADVARSFERPTAMHSANEQTPKMAYTTPQLRVHGTLQEVTKTTKGSGASDGFGLKGIAPITITSVS
jgi:hypothetical protein